MWLRHITAVLAVFSLLVSAASAREAAAGDKLAVSFLVLREHGTGTAAQAQPHVDALLQLIGKQTGWSVSGQYKTQREQGEAFIAQHRPQFALLSLAAFLALRKPHGLKVVGKVDAAQAGGRRYYMVSSKRTDVAGCRKGGLASDHLEDPRFIERAVARGTFKLGDFELVPTRRPVQTLKKVVRGEAVCALIDDAQHAALAKVEGGAALKTVWSSLELPPMVLVAFKQTGSARNRELKASLGKVCRGQDQDVCRDAGIRSLTPAGSRDYAAIVKAYGS